MNVVRVPIGSIKPHPRNYRGHPAEQVEHIRASLRQYGQYRPIVVSSDGYILAGEGVWTACNAEGYDTVETVPQPFDHTDTRAEKLLVLDNEVSRAAVDDDKALASLLAEIQRTDAEGLQGTGWDDAALDKLIGSIEYEHMAEEHPRAEATLPNIPEYEKPALSERIIIETDSAAATQAICDVLGIAREPGRVRYHFSETNCAV